jgi:hypothetical protein
VVKEKPLPPGGWLTGISGEAKNGTGLPGGGGTEGSTVRRLLCVKPLYVAVIVAVETVETGVVVAVKTPEARPGEIVVRGGTWTVGLSLDSEIIAPLAGAGPVSDRVAIELAPPVTEGGLNARELGAVGVPGGTTFRRAVSVIPL